MNTLLQSVITNPEAREGQAIEVAAAQAGNAYLPWSDEAY